MLSLPGRGATESKQNLRNFFVKTKVSNVNQLAHFSAFFAMSWIFKSKVHGALFGKKGKPYQTLSVF